MNKDDFTESVPFLIGKAEEAGFRISPTQIARWHRHKLRLLPRPWQRPLGRGMGTETLYPTGTARQLIALCEISLGPTNERNTMRQRGRSPEFVAWQLWWRGYRVEIDWRAQLREVARACDKYRDPLGDLATASPKSDRKLTMLIEWLSEGRSGRPLLRQIRRRVGTPKRDRKSGQQPPSGDDAFKSVLRLLAQIATGQFQGTTASAPSERDSQLQELDLLEKAMGLHRARVRQWPSPGAMISGSLNAVLAEVSTTFREPFGKSLKNTSDHEVAEAHRELYQLLELLSNFGQVMRGLFGPHAFGLSVIDGFRSNTDARLQATMLLFWIRLRRTEWVHEGAQAILGHAQGVRELYGAYSTAELIRQEMPELSAVLSPNRLKRAAADANELERITAEVQSFCDLHHDKVAAFRARHPELQPRPDHAP